MNLSDNFDLTAVITTIRHGEKDSKGDLTHGGHIQGAKRGALTHYLEGDIILLHSGVGRVKNTLLSLANHLHLTDPDGIKEILDHSNSFQDYTSQNLQYLFDLKNKGTLFGSWDDVIDSHLENERIQSFLLQKDMSDEPEIYPSPKQMAQRIGRVLLAQIDFATITTPEVRTNFINGTHEPVITSFLYYFLQDFNPTNDNFIHDVGGTVHFSEGFDIYIYQDSKDNHSIFFQFRGIEKKIDMKKLREFCVSEIDV